MKQKVYNEIRKLSYKYKNSPIWFGGDMNLPDIDWTTNTIINHQYVKEINESFLEAFETCNMEQIIDFPTRGENILEIVATNRPNLIYRCLPYPGMSDHDTTILLDIDCRPKKTKQKSRMIHI